MGAVHTQASAAVLPHMPPSRCCQDACAVRTSLKGQLKLTVCRQKLAILMLKKAPCTVKVYVRTSVLVCCLNPAEHPGQIQREDYSPVYRIRRAQRSTIHVCMLGIA